MNEREQSSLPSDETLDKLRQDQAIVRVVRDSYESNDVIGKIMGWDDEVLLIRKERGTVLKVKRMYPVQDSMEPRMEPYKKE
ncbi:MAG: hypothetical protein WD907_04810 [Bacilli bacterium]